MPFDTFPSRLQIIAGNALTHCRNRYGGIGLKVEENIDKSISWKPTFFLRPEKFCIVAVEVNDNLYPEILKIAAHDIGLFDFPISVYQACSLMAYQTDPKQGNVSLLLEHGFGIITVDEDGIVTKQHSCIPIIQHIPSKQFEKEIHELRSRVQVSFRTAYEVYRTNAGQGVQQAAQIVEGLVRNIALQAAKNKVITSAESKKDIAKVIDILYKTTKFEDHRATLGGARNFIKEYRNPSSHPPRNVKEATDKIRKCKRGFSSAIEVSHKLQQVATSIGYVTKIFVT